MKIDIAQTHSRPIELSGSVLAEPISVLTASPAPTRLRVNIAQWAVSLWADTGIVPIGEDGQTFRLLALTHRNLQQLVLFEDLQWYYPPAQPHPERAHAGLGPVGRPQRGS